MRAFDSLESGEIDIYDIWVTAHQDVIGEGGVVDDNYAQSAPLISN